MARKRDPRRDEAFEIYKKTKGDIKLKDIAEQLGISEGTVRGWKNKDKWDEQVNGTFQKKTPKNTERSKKKKEAREQPDSIQSGSGATVKYELVESDGLNDKQMRFCRYYVNSLNATSAYKKAYKCSYEVAMANGSRLLRKAKIQEFIAELKRERLQQEQLDQNDVLQKYKSIAFADITDYADFGTVTENALDPTGNIMRDEEGKIITYERSFVHLHNADEIDGTIVTEVKRGKDGVSVKLADKMKALEFLAKYTDLLNERELQQLKVERERVNIEKTRSDMTKDDLSPINITIRRKGDE